MAPSASRETGPPTRSNAASVSECWPWSRSLNDDLLSSSAEGEQRDWVSLAGWEWGESGESRNVAYKRLMTEDNVDSTVQGVRRWQTKGGE